MRRAPTLLAPALIATLAGLGGLARADAPADTSEERPAASPLANPGQFLHGLQGAGPNTSLGAAAAFAGFDGARRTPVFDASAEVAIGRRFSLRAGAAYLPN